MTDRQTCWPIHTKINKSFEKVNSLKTFFICVSVLFNVLGHVCGHHGTTCRGWISSFTMWVLRENSGHETWQQAPSLSGLLSQPERVLKEI